MLTLDNVSFRYDETSPYLLKDLSFRLEPGEFVCLLGTSGCGKSTIFRLINRLLTPTAGEIRVNGKPIAEQKSYCGYMPQQDLLFPWRTVAENLCLPMEIRGGIPKAEMRCRAEEKLRAVGLEGWADRAPRELSGGMRQRAAFARTLLTGCDLLLLDEPFSALDYLTRLGMREWLLEQWERERHTVLFITHDVEEALFLSSRILVVTEQPIAELRSVPVPGGYPRTEEHLARPDILALKGELIAALREVGV